MTQITVIGAGYVGLVSAACFAQLGVDVTCMDVEPTRIEALQRGAMPIYEPGLARLVAVQRKLGRLHFSGFEGDIVAKADLVFLAVGTPPRPGGDEADLSHVFAAARMVARHLQPGAVLVTKSTVTVGTNRTIRAIVEEVRPGLEFSVVSNPEFLREGCAIQDFLQPDRIVVGHHDEAGRAAMEDIYGRLRAKGIPLVFTSLENAELIKYAANAFLAMKIAFINEVADLCEAADGDVEAVAEAIGMDPRIGPRFLKAGPGFGGSCFPKDTRAFAGIGRRLGRPQRLIETVIESNEARKKSLVERVVRAAGSLHGKTVAVLGAAFKPGTDDIRESPALHLIPALAKAGAQVRFYDPQVASRAAPELGLATKVTSLAAALDGADVAILLTEWDEFRTLDLDWARDRMAGSVFLDLRNVFDAAAMERAGFDYVGIGRAGADRSILAPAPHGLDVEPIGAAPRAIAGMELANL